MMFRIYPHSSKATLCSFLGWTVLAAAAVELMGRSFVTAAVLAAVALGLIFLGKKVNEKKEFQLWLQRLEKSGEEDTLRHSLEAALAAYDQLPSAEMLAYLSSLNPEAAAALQARKDKKK